MNLPFAKLLYLSFVISTLSLKPAIAENTVASEQPAPQVASTAEKPRPYSAYCGVYCLYTVMKLYNIDIDPNELLKPKYISSFQGSSLAELKKAAEDYGLNAVAVGNMTVKGLRQSPYPVILHVKSAPDEKQYDHFELFLETKNGEALLYDPPHPARPVPLHKLVPRWDGTGLIISKGPIKLGLFFVPALIRFLIYAAIAVAIIVTVRRGRRRWHIKSRGQLFGLSIAQSAAFAILALLCGMVYHFTSDIGFLAHANAVAPIEQAHIGSFLPKVSSREMRRMLNDNNVILVDARFSEDFEQGHLEGAINFPMDCRDDSSPSPMINVPKDARIVVYCQTAACGFAEEVAIELISDGFSNVSLFKGNWQKLAERSDK